MPFATKKNQPPLLFQTPSPRRQPPPPNLLPKAKCASEPTMTSWSPKDIDAATRRQQQQHGRRHSACSSWWISGIPSNSNNKKKKKKPKDHVAVTPAAYDHTHDAGRSRWDSSESLAMEYHLDEDGSIITTPYNKTWTTTTTTGEPRQQRWTVVTLSTLLFFMAAVSIGLVSNTFLLAAEKDWQKYTTTTNHFINNEYGLGGLRAASDSHQPRHLTTLFESYHGPLLSGDPPPMPRSRRRPKLVIHIGPDDDMATTIQAELTFFQDRLALDDYVYLGRFNYPHHNDNDHNAPESSMVPSAQHFRDLFLPKCRRGQLQCMHHLRDLLLHTKLRRRTNDNNNMMLPNLLISDAALLKLLNADHDDDADEVTTTAGHSEERRDETYAMINNVLGRDFDIVIVINYRRFFEWLPTAAKQQHPEENDDESNIISGVKTSSDYTPWPGKESSGGVVGVVPPPLLPDHQSMSMILDEWRREHFLTSTTYATLRNLTAHYSPHFTVKIVHSYNDNQQLSMRTNFLCHAVPDAHHSCRASHRDDTIRRMRHHRDDDDETRIDARSLLTTTTTNREKEYVAVDVSIPYYPDVFFDALATAAISYIDTDRWDRPTVAKMLRDHYHAVSRAHVEEQRAQRQQLLHQSPHYPEPSMTDVDPDDVAVVPAAAAATTTTNNNNNPWQLPIVCPSRERLEEILHHSLSLEARMLPKLFQKSLTTHVADFWTVATKTFDFCWIDAEIVLRSDDDDDAGGGGESPWKRHIIDTFSAIDNDQS